MKTAAGKASWIRAALRWGRRLVATMGVIALVAWVGWLCLPKAELFPGDLTFSRVVLDRDGNLLRLTLTADGKYRLPANLDAVAADVIRATLAKEDRRFHSHPGIDPRGLLRAGWGVISGQRLGGGSTLTMQYARLRWGLNTRSLRGKCAQIFRAAQLERHYSKRELLEAYLTLAPYGGNVEGINAAAIRWCGKTASALNEREAIALSVIPQSPARRRPRPEGNPHLSAAQARLRAQLYQAPSDLDIRFALAPQATLRHALHFSRRVLRESPSVPAISTTLDGRAQQRMEEAVSEFLNRWHRRGLRNTAAILVHAPTREIRAYTGSAAFFDEAIAGQVDAVTARRSSGSTLKPFIYALALDAGLIHPGTLLDDAPRDFGSYNPENSDRAFLGPITAEEALRRSRNIPSVELLSKLSGGGLDAFLRANGVRLSRPPGDYGLALALGGAEVTLEELAALYSALATDGVAKPLQFARTAKREAESTGRPLLSPAARWLTLGALRHPAPLAPSGLAWKTGTSHGFRDAWACGAIGEWVLCVWVGHCDATPMPGLFARETAAPLLFEMAHRLELRPALGNAPPSIVQASLCSDSGMLAQPCCPRARLGPFVAGVSPIAPCDVHRAVFVNAEGLQVEPGTPGARRLIAEFWPPHWLEQFRRAGLPRPEPPRLARTHSAARPGAAPQIVSPSGAVSYVIDPVRSEHRAIPLQARAAAGVQRIHWFAGSQYLGSSRPTESLLWMPSPGKWSVQASDDFGRVAAVSVTVTSGGF